MTQPSLPLNDGHVCYVERDEQDQPTTQPTPCGHLICRRYVGRYPYRETDANN